MDLAINKAREAYRNGEVPVGAVIVNNEGEIVESAANSTISNHNPTDHAEMIVIRKVLRKLSVNRLDFCDLYVTLQPCPMCSHAISLTRIRRLYFGAYDKSYNLSDYSNHQKNFYKPEIVSGLSEDKCSRLLKDFFRELR
tara:strand:- start:959 stop:1378 length:420 start_codon:yes stop_codon:yes gene_type:complete